MHSQIISEVTKKPKSNKTRSKSLHKTIIPEEMEKK